MANNVNIFISYGRADARDMALRLRDDLQALGYGIWLDLEQIPGGASWSVNIEEAIEYCHVTLALMSQASYESQWCRAEQLRSLRKGKQVIPLLVQAKAELPLILEHLNYLDFSDEARYSDMLRDLVSDMTAGQAFRIPQTDQANDATTPFRTRRRQSSSPIRKNEKRNAPAFRRHIAALRREDWLGSRYWWPYFLFHYTDMHTAVHLLQSETIQSPFAAGGNLNTRWDKFVRLYFRPRTPDLYRNEGFRPSEQTPEENYCPIPVYMLFDLEATICLPEARFSEGDPVKVKKTYKTPGHFNELPFEQIYHDSWFLPDERDEIMSCREAQVVIPDQLGLEGLQFIWVRSEAEYDTLRHLLPVEVWHKWRDKITTRTDYHLFNRKWVYVEEAALEDKQARLRFNPCENQDACSPFYATAIVEDTKGVQYTWRDEAFSADNDLLVTLPKRLSEYTIQLLLDGDLAYAGEYKKDDGLI